VLIGHVGVYGRSTNIAQMVCSVKPPFFVEFICEGAEISNIRA
jgi:hypothetical protein